MKAPATKRAINNQFRKAARAANGGVLYRSQKAETETAMIKPVAVGMRILAVFVTLILNLTNAFLSGGADLLTILSQEILTPFAKQVSAANAKLETLARSAAAR